MNMSYCTFALQGIPEFDGINNLVQTLTNFIYICSVEHSATNFPQFDQYAFPPNYPALLREGDQNEIVSVSKHISISDQSLFGEIMYHFKYYFFNRTSRFSFKKFHKFIYTQKQQQITGIATTLF